MIARLPDTLRWPVQASTVAGRSRRCYSSDRNGDQRARVEMMRVYDRLPPAMRAILQDHEAAPDAVSWAMRGVGKVGVSVAAEDVGRLLTGLQPRHDHLWRPLKGDTRAVRRGEVRP